LFFRDRIAEQFGLDLQIQTSVTPRFLTIAVQKVRMIVIFLKDQSDLAVTDEPAARNFLW